MSGTQPATDKKNINLFFKELTDPDEYLMKWRKVVVICVSIAGSIFNLLELGSYLILFFQLYNHNNSISKSNLLESNVVKQRNRVNAISLTGQVITW